MVSVAGEAPKLSALLRRAELLARALGNERRIVHGGHAGSRPRPRISIPHLGFRYCYRLAAGSLRAGVRYVLGGLLQARRAGRLGYPTFAEPLGPGPTQESSTDSSATPNGAD